MDYSQTSGHSWSARGKNVAEETKPAVPRAPLRFERVRVDEKGRVKLPVDFADFIRGFGQEEVFICRLQADRAIRLYPGAVHAENLLFMEERTEATLRHSMWLLLAKHGGTSKLDPEGRVVLPHSLRTALELTGRYLTITPQEHRLDLFTDDDLTVVMQAAEEFAAPAIPRMINRGWK